MLSAAKVPLFFWAEAITTACFTQNCSLVLPRHDKTPYHIINDRKPSVKFFYIFGSVCYIVRDGENLDKIKEKGDECIFVGYSTQSRAYRVFNKKTRVIMESIHVNFDELPQMASDQNSSDPAPECQTMTLEHDSLSPGHKCQENVSHGDKTVTTLNELDLLFTPMFDELLNGPSQVVSKSSAVTTADESIQRQQQQTTSLVNHRTPEQSCQILTLAPTVISYENINQAELNAENDQVADDEFINIFLTPVQDQGETSSRHVDLSNMHTFYQRYPSKHRWTKDHPLEQVIGNPSESVRTRRQLESDAEMCMFALTDKQTLEDEPQPIPMQTDEEDPLPIDVPRQAEEEDPLPINVLKQTEEEDTLPLDIVYPLLKIASSSRVGALDLVEVEAVGALDFVEAVRALDVVGLSLNIIIGIC
nr:hypothetical protein [Tanacetum cinerariifolium]